MQSRRSVRTKIFKPQVGDEIFLGDEKIVILWVSRTKIDVYRRRRGKRGRCKTYDLDWWVEHWESSPLLNHKER